MANYKSLIVWEKSMLLTEEVYRIVRSLPAEEKFGLSEQMRRAAVSIPSNIAEGHGRDSKKELYHFLSIAQGSRSELETQIELCRRLEYLSGSEAEKLLSVCLEIEKMLTVLMKKLKTSL